MNKETSGAMIIFAKRQGNTHTAYLGGLDNLSVITGIPESELYEMLRVHKYFDFCGTTYGTVGDPQPPSNSEGHDPDEAV